MMAPDRERLADQQGGARKVRALAVAFIRFRFTDDVARLTAYLRELPLNEGRLARPTLVLAALLVVATPVLATLAPRLDTVLFQDVSSASGTSTIPTPALIIALAAFAAAWGYLLVGAAQGPGLLWIAAGLLYVYQVWPIGFPLGRSVLHLIPLSLPVVIGGLTSHGPVWGKTALTVLLANVGARSLPPLRGAMAFWILWAVVGIAFVGLYASLRRYSWPAGRRLGLAVSILLGYFLLVMLASRSHGVIAGTLNGSLNDSLWFLTVLWFLLGASFVSGAVALSRFARDAVGLIIPRSAPLWTLGITWGALVAWVAHLPAADSPVPLRPAAIIVSVGLIIVAVRWARGRMTGQWLSTAFVATAAAVLIVEAVFTLDLAETIQREAGVLSLLGFVYALVWEVTGRLPAIPGEIPGLPRPAPLLLCLGMILLVVAAALFGFAANLRFFQGAALLSQFKGAITLWVPVLLLTLARTWPAFPPAAGRRAIQAFAIGMAAAVPGLAARSAFPMPLTDVALIVAVVGVAVVLVARWADVRTPLPAAAVGYAMAYGFAASLSQDVLIPVLAGLLNVVGSLFLLDPLNTLSASLFQMALAKPWGAMEQQLFAVTMPFVTAMTAMVTARVVTRAAPSASQSGGKAPGNA